MSSKKRRELIIPVFIPFLGCPHKCIFCRQDRITGQTNNHVRAEDVTGLIEQALRSPKYKTAASREVAFYGGTFTSLQTGYMSELLGAVEPYIKDKMIDSIRISTRPDEIDAGRLELIRSYGVTTVELGVQSMNNDVLRKSGRGHTAEHTVNAIALLKKHGFKTGVQLMPGLPGDSCDIFQATVESAIGLAPDMARIYPAIVIKGTGLAELYRAGKYKPLSLDEAVSICSVSCMRLEENGIKVIRMGLMSTPSLLEEGEILAGPWHDAFGFLVRSDIYLKKVIPLLPAQGTASIIGIRMAEREIPLLRGYENKGVKKIEDIFNLKIEYIRAEGHIPSGKIEVDILG
ncbi:MAG: radical SAM protein [Deltaproteobacteria bacterium]|nr:radical SAM protein [Deltaproteobacteria bacterium]